MGLGVIGDAKDWAAFGGGRNMRKRGRTGVDTAALDVYKREVGELSTRRFAHRLAASEVLFSNFPLFLQFQCRSIPSPPPVRFFFMLCKFIIF